MPQVIPAAASWLASTAVAALNAGVVWESSVAFIAIKTAAEVALTSIAASAINAISSKGRDRQLGTDLSFRIDPAAPRRLILGETMLAGTQVAHYSYAKNNSHLSLVIALADHRCEGLMAVFESGRAVHGGLTHGVRTEITAYSYSGGPRCYITWFDGRPGQSADANLITYSAGDPDVIAGTKPPWTSAHVGRGVAYVHIEYFWDSDMMTSPVEFAFLVRGARLYDRRLDSTAGGSGSQRHDDPSTWTYSTNAAVALDHYLLGYKVENEDIAFGVGLLKEEVPYDVFAVAADLSDEDVTTGVDAGVEIIKRYRANGAIGSEVEFDATITDLQAQMAARVVDLGGRIGILGAEDKAITLDLTADDLVADEPFAFEDKRRFDDLVGAVEGRFSDPGMLYEPTDYERQSDADAIFPDGGEAQTITLTLPFETHPRRAARLARAHLDRERRQSRISGTFMPQSLAIKLEPGDFFTFTDPLNQLDEEPFEVIDIAKRLDGTVQLTGQAVDPDFLVFPNDEDPDLSVPPSIDPADLILDAPEFTIEVYAIDGDDGATLPGLLFTLTSDEPFGRDVVIEYRRWNADDEDFETSGRIALMHASAVVQAIGEGLLPHKLYKARAKLRVGHRESPWTDWSEAIETGDYVAPAAVTAGDVTPGSALEAALEEIAAEQAEAAEFFPGFAIVSAHGDLTFEANEDAAGAISINPGYIDHPVLGRIDIDDEEWFRTPWTNYLAPPNGWFGVAFSETPVAERFAEAASPIGAGHFFPFAYVDGTPTAFGRFSYVAVPFTPELTDVVVAKAIKPLAEGSDEYSSADGITEIESYIRDTLVVNTRLNALEVSVGEATASITSLETAIADETEARVSAVELLEADLAGVAASVSTVASAVSALDGRVSAYYGVKVDAGTGEASLELLAIGGDTPSGLVIITADIFKVKGAAIFDGEVTAEKLDVSELSAIVANLGEVTAGIVRNGADTHAFNADIGVTVSFAGSNMKVTGAAFGASNDLSEWFGPTPSGATTVDPKLSTLTKANGNWAQGTDGLTYLFGAELRTMFISPSPTNQQVSGSRSGAGSVTTTAASAATVLGGNGAYTYAWTYVSGDTFTINSPTGSSTTGTASVTVGNTKSGYYKCTVTDTATGRTASIVYRFLAIENT